MFVTINEKIYNADFFSTITKGKGQDGWTVFIRRINGKDIIVQEELTKKDADKLILSIGGILGSKPINNDL